jgi:hypothetical protein
VVVLHALLWFAQRWSVKFRAFVQYRVDERAASAGSYLLVEPHEHQGRADIVRVQRDSESVLYFVFQHQRFEIDEARQEVTLLSTAINLPLQHYAHTRGLRTSDVFRLQQRFGSNSVELPPPTFVSVYVNQLLGPVPVFQVACVRVRVTMMMMMTADILHDAVAARRVLELRHLPLCHDLSA